LSIIDIDYDWKPAITIKQILLGVQELLDTPNPKSPANGPALKLYTENRAGYIKRVKQEALANRPSD
jgi:ubiquitin-conjugating enzyme E2 I